MNWDQVEGQWHQLTGQVRSQWAKLTDDDVKNVAGKREQLVGKLHDHETFAGRDQRPQRKSRMHRSILSLAIAAPMFSACGASMPPPTQRMANAESAERSARELGAESQPSAKLSLSLAEEQRLQAKKAMADGDNERADSLLIRATADAELAIAQARQQAALIAGQAAVDQSAAQGATNASQGAVK